METIVRRSVGIDVAKATFTACICTSYNTCKVQISEVVQFDNSKRGFNQLLKWVRKNKVALQEVVFVMEATGVYYEPLAYHLHKLGVQVAVVLPNKVKHYAKSLNVKSKTDAVDARLIAQMGAERSLELWEPPQDIFRQLRAATRLYADLKMQRTEFSNRLHHLQAGYSPSDFVVRSTKQLLAKVDSEIKKCEAEIKRLVAQEDWLEQKVERLLTIKGIGLMSICIVLGETQGFKLITNGKQLASYAGYDVVERQSGSSVKGHTKISKKGNSRIRAALFFPALVASRYNPHFKEVYQRINQGKTSKLVGATALQRKMLLLLYTLWKNNTTYEERTQKQISGNQETKLLLREKDEALENKTGRPVGLPAQDELPLNLSTEVLLR